MITVTQHKKTVPVFPGSKMSTEMLFNVNEVTGRLWRLIHDGERVLFLFEGADDNVTTTIYNVEEFETKREALAWATQNGLKDGDDGTIR